jgi:hypothetical protein
VTVHVSVLEGLNFPGDDIGAYAVAVVIQLQVCLLCACVCVCVCVCICVTNTNLHTYKGHRTSSKRRGARNTVCKLDLFFH